MRSMRFMKKPYANKTILYLFILAVVVIASLFGIRMLMDAAYVPVIIMYHSVGSENIDIGGYEDKLNVPMQVFRDQMRFLSEHDYKVIPLENFVNKIKRGEKIPRKTIAITFDDGLRNNFLMAYPILKEYNFPATFFVISGFVGQKSYVTWDDLSAMSKDVISIGSHTLFHKWLPDKKRPEIEKELVESRIMLENNTGRKVLTLSYPLGGFSEEVKEMAREAGYIGACATNPGREYRSDDPYALKRIRISASSKNVFVFLVETSGYYTFIKEIRDD